MGWVLDMTGHLVSFVLGLVLLVGIVLCMTVVGLTAGIPLCILGAVMMFKSLLSAIAMTTKERQHAKACVRAI